jgi:hypothetical protein
MPETHRTLPPPCDRYGGFVPPCSQLANAIKEAEDYLRSARQWLTDAQANVRFAEAELKLAEAERNTAIQRRDAAWQQVRGLESAGQMFVPGSIGRFTADYQRATEEANAAMAARKAADSAVAARRQDLNEANKACENAKALVDRSEAWLKQLIRALANCPPPATARIPGATRYDTSKQIAGGGDGGTDAAPEPAQEGSDENSVCAEVAARIAADEAKLEEFDFQLIAVSLAADEAQIEYDEALSQWNDAEAATVAARTEANAIDTHIRSADGSYVPNPARAAVEAKRQQAEDDANDAKSVYEEKTAALNKVRLDLAAIETYIENLWAEIDMLKEELRKCGTSIGMAPGARSKLLGAAAFAVASFSVVAVLLMGGGHAHRPATVKLTSVGATTAAPSDLPTPVVVPPEVPPVEDPLLATPPAPLPAVPPVQKAVVTTHPAMAVTHPSSRAAAPQSTHRAIEPAPQPSRPALTGGSTGPTSKSVGGSTNPSSNSVGGSTNPTGNSVGGSQAPKTTPTPEPTPAPMPVPLPPVHYRPPPSSTGNLPGTPTTPTTGTTSGSTTGSTGTTGSIGGTSSGSTGSGNTTSSSGNTTSSGTSSSGGTPPPPAMTTAPQTPIVG